MGRAVGEDAEEGYPLSCRNPLERQRGGGVDGRARERSGGESVRMEVDVRSTDRPPRVRQPVDESGPEGQRAPASVAEATNPRPSAERRPTTSSRTANAIP
ncbi:hypothetical protein KM043_007112 [Ampulex compressa]|nr:hypothetical protein KM043_007112 [Ampulex compressa]